MHCRNFLPFMGGLALSATLTACGLSFENPVTDVGAKPAQVIPTDAEVLAASIVERELPNAFEVRLDIAANQSDAPTLVLKRRDAEGNQVQLDLLSAKSTSYTDTTVRAGTKYS